MGKRDEALAFLRNGLDPVEISVHQKVTLATILAYLNEWIGAGKLRRLDVLFSVSIERRLKPPTKEYRNIVQIYGSAAHALVTCTKSFDTSKQDCTKEFFMRCNGSMEWPRVGGGEWGFLLVCGKSCNVDEKKIPT
jgi:hypothetical protein